MNDIIQTLLDIEKNSKMIMDTVEEDKGRIPKLVKEKVSQGIRGVTSRERDKIIAMRQDIERETNLKLDRIYSDFEEKKEALEIEYKDNHKKLQREILNSVING